MRAKTCATVVSLNLFKPVYRVKRTFFQQSICHRQFIRLLFLILICSLVGCTFLSHPGSVPGLQQNASFYRPPTPEGAAAPSTLLGSNLPTLPLLPTATIQCRDSLAFIKDITIPDGTVVAPVSTLDKRWEVENNGNCNWAQGYRVRLIAGTELSAQKEQALYPARSGSRAVIRMVFKAPAEPGTYRSAWQAFNSQGEPFGDPFFIEVKVEASGTQ